MKYIVICFGFFLALCEGDNVTTDDASELSGRWQLEATRISPGGLVERWTDVENGEIYEFTTDGAYRLTNSHNDSAGVFEWNEDVLSLFPEDKGNDQQNYGARFVDKKLILNFIGCIEECSFRYRKIE